LRQARLQALIRGRVSLASVIHSDGFLAYDGLVDLGYKKHFRVRHGANEFAKGRCHINGIESFWSFAKTRLAKFRGVRPGLRPAPQRVRVPLQPPRGQPLRYPAQNPQKLAS
jgi:hypothetical protein